MVLNKNIMVKFNIKIYFKDIFIYEYNSKHDSKIIIDKRIVSVINKGGEIAKTMGIHNCILCGISKISNITSTYNKECRNIRIDITNIIYKKCGEYDCYIKELNLLIEYVTPAFHPNEDFMSKELCMKSMVYETYDKQKDYAKEKLALERGFDFYRCYVINKQSRDTIFNELKKYINKRWK